MASTMRRNVTRVFPATTVLTAFFIATVPPASAAGDATVAATSEEATQLAVARDAAEPAGTRNMALRSYAKQATAAGHGVEAAQNIWALRGQIAAMLADPVYDALILVGPEAMPLLVKELRKCLPKVSAARPAADLKALSDPKTTITIHADGSVLAAICIAQIADGHPSSPEVTAAIPDLVKALECGDVRTITQVAGSIAAVGSIPPTQLAAVRRLLPHPHERTRALAASVLAAVSATDAKTIEALERALPDRIPLVRLSAANALIHLGHPMKARLVLQRLASSPDAEIAGLAQQILEKDQPAQP